MLYAPPTPFTCTTLTRDPLHRVYRVDYPQTPGYPAFAVEVTRDEFGRVTQSTDSLGTSTASYDDLNRTVSSVPSVGRGVTYQYLNDLPLARRITRATLSGVGLWEIGEDGKGREAQVLNPYGQLTTTRFDRDAKPRDETKSNGARAEYAWTPRDWLGQGRHRLLSGALLDQFDLYYTDGSGVYDPTGNIQREVDLGGRTHAFSRSYHYELTAETHPDFGTLSYSLDVNGNRLSKSATGITEWAGYDAQNKLLWTNQGASAPPSPGQSAPYRLYSYDLNGRPTLIEHRDAPGLGVVQDQHDWDGSGLPRRIKCVGTTQERWTADWDASGERAPRSARLLWRRLRRLTPLPFDGACHPTPDGVPHRRSGRALR
jgi:hypothetical protein